MYHIFHYKFNILKYLLQKYIKTIHELQKGLRVLSWIEELSIIGSIDDELNVLFLVNSCESLISSFSNLKLS